MTDKQTPRPTPQTTAEIEAERAKLRRSQIVDEIAERYGITREQADQEIADFGF